MQASKPYQLKFENRPEYLYASITAERETLEICEAIWSEIAQQCSREKCGKLLVEQDIPDVDMSYFEKYECVNKLISVFMKIDIAFAGSYIEQMQLNKFTELVATNRGLSFKVFNNFDAAEKWLRSF